jgi:UDP-N-acetylglucosamine 2-epimerase (non-hydrolysing)
LNILRLASELAPVFFVAHPRTRERLHGMNVQAFLREVHSRPAKIEHGVIYLLPPLPYLDFMRIMTRSKCVLTDSGGIQEETTYLGIPCLTMRSNTERPVTVAVGTNVLVGLDAARIRCSLEEITAGKWKGFSIPPLWDGRAAARLVPVLQSLYDKVVFC